MKLKTIEFITVQAALALLLVACNNKPLPSPDRVKPGKNQPTAAQEHVPAPLTQQMIYRNEHNMRQTNFSSKGAIVSENNVDVISRINEQIVWLGVELGQRVRKGQVLVRLDRTATEDMIMKARAELEEADYRYQAILMGQGYKRDALDQAPEKLRQQARSSSGYNTAKAELRHLEHQLSYCTIEAPISGVVSHLETDQYDMAIVGKPLFRIIDTDHLKVCFEVLENELHSIGTETAITVIPISYPEESYDTHISAVSPLVEKTGMVHMEAPLPYYPHLKPGMTVVVTLTKPSGLPPS